MVPFMSALDLLYAREFVLVLSTCCTFLHFCESCERFKCVNI